MRFGSSKEDVERELNNTTKLLTTGFEARYGRVSIHQKNDQAGLVLSKQVQANSFEDHQSSMRYLKEYSNKCPIIGRILQCAEYTENGTTSYFIVSQYWSHDLSQEIKACLKAGKVSFHH